MKWLRSTFALIAIVGATVLSSSAFAYHRHWHHHHYAPRADVTLGFAIGDPWYAPARRYYWEPAPRYYYGPAPGYYYYGYSPGYYYYGHPDEQPYYDPRFPPATS
jgi:hypothetical protein